MVVIVTRFINVFHFLLYFSNKEFSRYLLRIRVAWKVLMIMLYLLLITFLPKGSKHGNTDGKSVWTLKETMLKNKTHFHECILISQWVFSQLSYIPVMNDFLRLLFDLNNQGLFIRRNMYLKGRRLADFLA